MKFLIWPAFMVGDGSKVGARVTATSPELAVRLWHFQHKKASPGGKPIDVVVRNLSDPDEPDAVYEAEVVFQYTVRRK